MGDCSFSSHRNIHSDQTQVKSADNYIFYIAEWNNYSFEFSECIEDTCLLLKNIACLLIECCLTKEQFV